MTDRLASSLSAFDLLAVTLAGAVFLGGVAWAFDELPEKSPSAVGLLGLLASSYVVGHLIHGLSTLIWKREEEPDDHPWVRALRKTLQSPSGETSTDAASKRLRQALSDVDTLSVYDQAQLIRAVLRQRGLDARFESMNVMAWTARALATTAGLLMIAFLSATAFGDHRGETALAAIGALAAAVLFHHRTRHFQNAAGTILKFDALALVAPPLAASDAATPSAD